MSLILNIDTAIDTASVCLAKNGDILLIAKNESQKDHAAWLHMAIKEILDRINLELDAIDAVAVTQGPGSYTGLRIGMATAKGICYALNKPLITLNTLQVMANAVTFHSVTAALLCPMIDARRMDVFTAIYSRDLKVVKEPAAITLSHSSLDEELKTNTICFFGNGSKKFQSIVKSRNAIFTEIGTDAASMALLSVKKCTEKEFADLAYVEPMYLKEFYISAK